MDLIVSIDKVLYKDVSNGYKIALCSTDDEIPDDVKEPNRYKTPYSNVFIAKGVEVPPEGKLSYKLSGDWAIDKRGKKYFNTKLAEQIIQPTKAGILEYLKTLPNIGPTTANKIYDAFGADTINVIENDIDRLATVKGVTLAKVDQLKESVFQQNGYQKVVKFFLPYNIPMKQTKKVCDCFKEKTMEIINTHPYELFKFFGFTATDEIARTLNVDMQSYWRIHCAVLEAFRKISSKRGHLFIELRKLIQETSMLLNIDPSKGVDIQKIKKAIVKMKLEKDIIIITLNSGKHIVYASKAYLCEKQSAIKLVQFLMQPHVPLNEEMFAQNIKKVQSTLNIILSTTQVEAVKTSISNNISIITGGPGTGKTTILKVIIAMYQLMSKDDIHLCAPTGRAARRMAESTGNNTASTIHHMLGLNEDFTWTDGKLDINEITSGLLIIDEFSMVDMELMYILLQAISLNVKVVFVGDADQLPSVGPGNVFREMIKSKQFPMTILDKIYRQASTNEIVINAHKIRHDDDKLEYKYGEFNLYPIDNQYVAKQTVALYLEELKKDGATIDNVQVLTPFRKSTMAASTSEINAMIQHAINPSRSYLPEIQINRVWFRKGDKVIQQRNTPDIKNGDIGIIENVSVAAGDSSVLINFGDKEVTYSKVEMDENMIDLAYAITIHKSQGSEYKSIIFPIISGCDKFFQRNLIYTAWTRAKESVTMVGSEQTLLKGIHQCNVDNRNTMFAVRISQYVAIAIKRMKERQASQAVGKQLNLM